MGSPSGQGGDGLRIMIISVKKGALFVPGTIFFPSKRSPAGDLLGPEAGLEVRHDLILSRRERVEDLERSSKEDC